MTAGQLSEKLRAERDECDSLRRDVERSITVERSEELEARCTSLEGQVMKLKVECEKQKAVAEIASRQAATIQAFTKSDKEVADALRKAVLDLQVRVMPNHA